MSFEPSVVARGLGKHFALHDTPGEQFVDFLWRRKPKRVHYVVGGVDLDVKVGDCVGIVGRNGAGKSTLLELIGGILEPSEGTIEVEGRVAALLQLGAGFNPEFTGRENVFVMGAIYGLDRDGIARRFDAIAEFAHIGAFIDRPVREYSSGMYARLAFAVCAHVDADILLVDEILGVGDYRFQQKSMRFLRRFRRRGIVFFVSHDEHAVSALCNKAIWIDGGAISFAGPTRLTLQAYRQALSRSADPEAESSAVGIPNDVASGAIPDSDLEIPSFDPDDPPPSDGRGSIARCQLVLADGEQPGGFAGGEEVVLEVVFEFRVPVACPYVFFVLRNPMGQIVLAGDSRELDGGALGYADAAERVECRFRFRIPYLPTGTYPVEAFLLSGEQGSSAVHDHLEFGALVKVLSRHISHGMANVRLLNAVLATGYAV